MNIEFYRPLWGNTDPIKKIADEAVHAGFSGLEGHLPEDANELDALKKIAKQNSLKFIGEICTGGNDPNAYWVPQRTASVDDHIKSFESELIRMQASELDIPFINCMGGLDAWSLSDALHFFENTLKLSEKYGFTVSFETHRTRCFYSPWNTFEILKEMPEILVTADLSHWCVVAERLIDEEEGLTAIIPLAHHIHGRVGYDQGPQVPQPAAPEYSRFVEAHQNWWEQIWLSQQNRAYKTTTMTTEYGPDGYMHQMPYSTEPIADLWEVMQWAIKTEREHFNRFQTI